MKKLLVLIAVVVGIGVLVKRFAPDLGQIDWEKKFEAMPDNAPVLLTPDTPTRVLDLYAIKFDPVFRDRDVASSQPPG